MKKWRRVLIGVGIAVLLVGAVAVAGASDYKITTKEKVFQDVDGKAKRESLLSEEGKQAKGQPVDTYYELDSGKQSTFRSVLDQVSVNLGSNKNLDADANVESLLVTFDALNEEGHIRYGVWGPDTPEGKAQAELLKGKTLKDAKKIADPTFLYWTDPDKK